MALVPRSMASQLMVKDNDQDVFSTKLIVVLNWARELTELTTKEKQ